MPFDAELHKKFECTHSPPVWKCVRISLHWSIQWRGYRDVRPRQLKSAWPHAWLLNGTVSILRWCSTWDPGCPLLWSNLTACWSGGVGNDNNCKGPSSLTAHPCLTGTRTQTVRALAHPATKISTRPPPNIFVTLNVPCWDWPGVNYNLSMWDSLSPILRLVTNKLT